MKRGTPFPRVILDRQWRYVEANEAVSPVVKRARDQIIGRTVWEVCPWLRGTEKGAMLTRAMRRQVAVQGRFRSLSRPGLDIMLTAAPVEGGGLEVIWSYSEATAMPQPSAKRFG